MRNLFLLTTCILLGISCQSNQIPMDDSLTNANIQVGEAVYEVEIRDDPEERRQGLSGKEFLAENEGMLFIFPSPEPLSFWMKEMQFPLDFVWINDGVIIGLDKDIPHPDANDGEIARILSPEPADMVLEINAGQIELQGLKIGDKVNLLQ